MPAIRAIAYAMLPAPRRQMGTLMPRVMHHARTLEKRGKKRVRAIAAGIKMSIHICIRLRFYN